MQQKVICRIFVLKNDKIDIVKTLEKQNNQEIEKSLRKNNLFEIFSMLCAGTLRYSFL